MSLFGRKQVSKDTLGKLDLLGILTVILGSFVSSFILEVDLHTSKYCFSCINNLDLEIHVDLPLNFVKSLLF